MSEMLAHGLSKEPATRVQVCGRCFDVQASTVDQGSQEAGIDVSTTSELPEYNLLAVVRDHNVATSVLGLLSRCRPSAITRRVWAVIVDAIQRTPFRTWPHIAEEASEVIAPLVAHRDAAAAPTLEPLQLSIEAAFVGVLPRSVFTSRLVSLSCAVSPVWLRFCVASATATSRALSQVSRCERALCSAITAADPHRFARLIIGSVHHRQVSESLACLVDQRHSSNYLTQVSS